MRNRFMFACELDMHSMISNVGVDTESPNLEGF